MFFSTLHVGPLVITLQSTPLFSCTWGAKPPIGFYVFITAPNVSFVFRLHLFPVRGPEIICHSHWPLLGVPGVCLMSAVCSPFWGLLVSRSPTPCLTVAGPIVRLMEPLGGVMRPSLLRVPSYPFCQAAYPVNYNLPAGPLGPGTMGPGLLRGPYHLPPVILQGPAAPQPWGPWGPLPSPTPVISDMVGPAGPRVHPPLGGPPSS